MKRVSLIAVVLAAMLTGCISSKTETGTVPSITPAETAKLLGHDASVVFLDVRTAAEFQSETGHLRGAVHIPVDSLEYHLTELEPYKSRTIIAYCRTGHRSSRAQKFLTEKGFHVLNMTGGITRWNKEQLPVVKEKQ